MKYLRPWATPLTIGAFAIMSTTGLLMFFHLESGLNKVAHEWAGWAMVTGVVAHAALNWRSFKRYLTDLRTGQVIIAAFFLVLGASFFVQGEEGEGLPPPVVALQGLMRAPVSTVAQVAGKPEAELVAALQTGGIAIESADQTLASVVGEDREKTDKAVRIIFAKP